MPSGKLFPRCSTTIIYLLLACQSPALLAARLIEPDLDVLIPVLVEVLVGDFVVVLHHFGSLCNPVRMNM